MTSVNSMCSKAGEGKSQFEILYEALTCLSAMRAETYKDVNVDHLKPFYKNYKQENTSGRSCSETTSSSSVLNFAIIRITENIPLLYV